MALYRCMSGGGTKTAVGTATLSTTGTTEINIGFKPKYLAENHGAQMASTASGNNYDERVSTTQATNGTTLYNLGGTSNGSIRAITDTGFIMNKVGSANYTFCRYFAIG